MLSQLQTRPRLAFDEFKKRYAEIYQGKAEPHPAWIPTDAEMKNTNLYRALQKLKFLDYAELYQWSITQRDSFWAFVIKTLEIKFKIPYSCISNHAESNETIQWLPGSRFNIVDSCFNAEADKTAIIYQDGKHRIKKMSYGELNNFVNQIANGIAMHHKPGTALAMDMPMTVEAVAIYLAIIRAGCVVVSIADSFAADEIAMRLRISDAKAIFTQDNYLRNGRVIELYSKVQAADATQAIVVLNDETTILRPGDVNFNTFISQENQFDSIARSPDDYSNILFSSGTTGDPKGIPWTHTTPVKAAMDAHFHQDVQKNDIMAWPTNLGWMMGPWLVYACFINQATMALASEAPTHSDFGQFIQDAKVSILGLVPGIVNNWRINRTMESFDWSGIKCFSSSGECSSPEDYLYLMWLANCRPVIEYCGGTEIGGGYISSTLLHPNTPACFSTPTLGIDFVLLSEDQRINASIGEVAIANASPGLSQTLINRDHHQTYFAGMPEYQGHILRRHGDQIQKINAACYRALGRVDDTMNLGGIKTSSAEIERVLNELPFVQETAAIAIAPKKGGPGQLVIYAICHGVVDKKEIQDKFQHAIRERLNPLFKIHDVIPVSELPRTASNKVMRRVLREQYMAGEKSGVMRN